MVSMRGGIVDFLPTHSKEPLRIEFFSDTIESIRYFDLDSQRSNNKREEVTIQKPPVLQNGQNNQTIEAFIKERCKSQLYITSNLIRQTLDKEIGDPLFYEPVDFKKMGAVEFQKKIETLSRELSSLCLLYTSPSPRDLSTSRMPSSA